MKWFRSFILLIVCGRVLGDKNAKRLIVQGSLGEIGNFDPSLPDKQGILPAAKTSLASLLKRHSGATGRETFRPGRNANKVTKDKQGRSHVRFEQSYEGLEVVDAAVVMHIDPNGTVYAMNGEFVIDGSVDTKELVSCEQAFADTVEKYGNHSNWLTDCRPKIVLDRDGTAHKAWERLIGYWPEDPKLPYQKDKLYASVATGQIVAIRPQVMGARSLRTEDCHNAEETTNCQVMSTNSNNMTTSDEAVRLAHNYAILTYNYYKEMHNRDSIDDKGMTIVSHVHVKFWYNNAFWDGESLNYGDGDDFEFTAFSKSLDVVGHEYSHGVTQYTSGLVYRDESGALNEAMSDIFGACVDRYYGASEANTWKLAETIYTPDYSGDALRYMDNPTEDWSSYDYYPERYQGDEDNGGVHSNSGVANLAFFLMVKGGMHPRDVNSVVVPAIDPNFDTSIEEASRIFYLAQTSCLTPNAGFLEARYCTLMHAGEHAASVEAAWEAVGVVATNFDAPITGISQEESTSWEGGMSYLQPGTVVTCTTAADNGDAELFMDMTVLSGGFGRSSTMTFSCRSESSTSNEACLVGPLAYVTKVHIKVTAYSTFSDLTLNCTTGATGPVPAPTNSPMKMPALPTPTSSPTKKPVLPTPLPTRRPTRNPTPSPTLKPTEPCKPKGAKCSKPRQCCGKNMACDGPSPTTRKCKPAVRPWGRCKRSTQCLKGYKCQFGMCTRPFR